MKLNQPYNFEFRDVLRLRREELEMTQKELGERIGYSAMGVSHFESGRRDIKLVELEKWVNALGLELEITINKIS